VHDVVFQAFDRICREEKISGDVLEIGARPSADTLLCLPSLRGSARRIGIDLDGPYHANGIDILAGDANQMTMFADGAFDAVLCNSVLEHDRFFWRSLAEIRRVLRPGGLFVVGVPGYGAMSGPPFGPLVRLLRRVPGLAGIAGASGASSPTLGLHQFPGDYYRFSRQAVAEIFLANFDSIAVETVLNPPRFIGRGRKTGTT
jgi:SAM-dependent methyltransferase